jgi:hypothetical protein
MGGVHRLFTFEVYGGEVSRVIGVSKAVWPLKERHCVPTGKAAQRRRILVLMGVWGSHHLSPWRTRFRRIGQMVSRHMSIHRGVQIGLVLMISGVVFIISAFYDWSMMLNHWFTFLPFAILCIFSTLTIAFAWSEHRQVPEYQQQPPYSITALPHSSVGSISVSTLGEIAPSWHGQSIPETHVPPHFSFPETPVPAPTAPLVRVLETVDLSSTNVQHFLDTKAQAAIFPPTEESKAKQKRNDTTIQR